jgi:hypothetical protein
MFQPWRFDRTRHATCSLLRAIDMAYEHRGVVGGWYRRAFAAALILPLLAIAARANAVVLTLSNPAVGIGSTAELAVSADDATGVEGLSFNIVYDPAVVRVASDVSVTDVTARCMVVSNGRVPGVIQVAVACLEPLDGSGPLFTVKLFGRGIGTSVLRIANCNLNEGSMACAPVAGLGTVQTASTAHPVVSAAADATLAQTSDLIP